MIRPATHEDVDAIVELGASMHHESNFSPIAYHAGHTAEFIHRLIDSDDGFAVVADRDGVVGFMLGIAYPAWFGNGQDKVASDLVLYVRPENRKGTSAIFLAQAFRDWAVKSCVVQARVGTAVGAEGQGANAIYEHLGFARAGLCFVLDLGGKNHAYQTFDHHLAAH